MRFHGACILAVATTVIAQYSYYDEDSFELGARDYDDFYDLETRDFDDEYEFNAREEPQFEARDYEDGYSFEARSPYRTKRDMMFLQPAQDPFHQMMDSWFRPKLTPFDSIMRKFSSPEHRGHSHMLLIPPQEQTHPLEGLLQSLIQSHAGISQAHSQSMSHMSTSSSINGHGTSCTSSTIIGVDGIPRTTKKCTTTSHPGPANRVFNGLRNEKLRKLLRNKRILELDAPPDRGTIKSFHNQHRDGDEHEDVEKHDANIDDITKDGEGSKKDDEYITKHGLRDEESIFAREAVAEAEPEAEAQLEHNSGTEKITFVVREADASADPEPEPQPEAESEPEPEPEPKAEALPEAVQEPAPLP